jgi:hypothetical protein
LYHVYNPVLNVCKAKSKGTPRRFSSGLTSSGNAWFENSRGGGRNRSQHAPPFFGTDGQGALGLYCSQKPYPTRLARWTPGCVSPFRRGGFYDSDRGMRSPRRVQRSAAATRVRMRKRRWVERLEDRVQKGTSGRGGGVSEGFLGPDPLRAHLALCSKRRTGIFFAATHGWGRW